MLMILSTAKGDQGDSRRRTAFLTLLLASVLTIGGMIGPKPTRVVAESLQQPRAADTTPLVAAGTADWISAVAEAITALSLGAVIWQISEQRRAARRERTRGYQERYQSEAFDASARRMVGCMEVEDAGGCVDVIKECSNRPDAAAPVLPWPDAPCKASVRDVDKTLNLFEEMGAAYKLGQMDEQTLLRSFSFPTIQVFVKGWWWICWEREGRLARQTGDGVTEETYVEFQAMVLALRKANRSLARHPELQPNREIRALCLPQGSKGKVDDDAAWSASRRLSLALSAFVKAAGTAGLVDRLSSLASELESLPKSSAQASASRPRRWHVILIPTEIDRLPDGEWEWQWKAAAKVAETLNRFVDYDSLDRAVTHVRQAAAAG
jgi:hypothetical protein